MGSLHLHLDLLVLIRDREGELLRDLIMVLLTWRARRSSHWLLVQSWTMAWRRHHLLTIYLNLLLVALVRLEVVESSLIATTAIIFVVALHILKVRPVLTLTRWSLRSGVEGVAAATIVRSLVGSILSLSLETVPRVAELEQHTNRVD